MPRYPSDIRRAPGDVRVLQVEHPLHRHQRMRQIAAGRMHDALGLAGRARGVERIQRMLRVDMNWFAIRALTGADIMPPYVAAGAHLDLLPAAPPHQPFLNGLSAL